ncbi:MAG: DNA polymerase III subunit beta [Clostridia bacterium]
MKFSIMQSSLTEALNLSLRAITSKTTMPILIGILIEAKEGHLIFRSTDLDISIEYKIRAEIFSEGITVIPARHFSELVKKLPNILLDLEILENGQLKITYGKSVVQLNTFNAQEFPQLGKPADGLFFTLKTDELANAVHFAAVAAGQEGNKAIFTGILLDLQEDCLNIVATDTHRLAYQKIKLLKKEGQAEYWRNPIIPAKYFVEACRMFRPEDTEVTLQIGKGYVAYHLDNLLITTRLIEGTFPDYAAVIPKGYKSRVRLLRRSISDALERAFLMARDEVKNRACSVSLDISEQLITIDTKSAEVGNIHEEIAIFLEGEETKIGFNLKYLLDALKAMKEEEIYFDLTGVQSPAILRPIEASDEYLFLVLPMKLI